MRIAYKLTSAEFIAAQNLHSRRSFIGFINIAICYFFAPLLGLGLMLSVVSFPKAGVNYSSLSKGFLPLLITLSPLWLYLYLLYRYKASRVSNGPYVFDFGEDVIATELPGFSKSIVEWAAIKKFRQSKKLLLIYLSRTSFLIVPRRACEAEDYSALITLLERKLKSGTK